MPHKPRPPSPATFIAGVLKTLGVVCLIVLIGTLVCRDLIIKSVAENTGSKILGAPLAIGTFSWGMFSQKITVKNLTIGHPPGFDKGEFIDIPQVVLQYDLPAMLKGKVHMPLVLVDLKEMVVVRNKDGKMNVDELKVLHPEKKGKVEIPPFKIDALKLNIGRVVFMNYYKRQWPEVLVYDVGLKDKTFSNLDTVPKLVSVILLEALKPTAIRGVGVYAAAALTGVGFIPTVMLGMITAKDSSVADLPAGFDKVFSASESFVRERGQLKKEDKGQGTINGNIDGTDLVIKLEKISAWKTRINISAHKYMMPRHEFAGGIVYQITHRL